MTATAMTRALAAFSFCVAAVASGQALAQNYDSAGLLRFGVFGQGSIVRSDLEIRDSFFSDAPNIENGSKTKDSFGGGLSFGYDLLMPNGWLIGLETDGSVDDWQDNRHSHELGIDWLATIRGRIGTYLRPGLLVYATGGVAFLGMEYKRTPVFDNLAAQLGVPFKNSRTLIGGIGGGGVEYEWNNIILFGEYLYASYGGFDGVDFTLSNGPEQYKVNVDEQHIFRLGVKFKIGYDFLEGPYGP